MLQRSSTSFYILLLAACLFSSARSFAPAVITTTSSSFVAVPTRPSNNHNVGGRFAAVSAVARGRRGGASASALSMSTERTYIMIKPDGVQRGLVGNIVSRFEQKGYKLVAIKTRMATEELLEQHYKDLVDKPFFPKLKGYMLSGPVCSMVWEGREAVSTGRKMLGATNPLDSDPGTIRGDFCLEVGRNICHGSDSVENADREIGLWFDESELLDWDSHSFDWLYE